MDRCERGIVFDIRRGCVKDGPGLRTSVFLKGCPLRCVWCHNPESQEFRPETSLKTGEVCGREMSVQQLLEEVLEDKEFYEKSGGGLTLTGGEPLVQPTFAAALAAAAKKNGIGVAVDTCGYATWADFDLMLESVDLFLYDLKCIDAPRHRRLTGVGNERILDNLQRLNERGKRIWLRCPLVHGLNDSDVDLDALAEWGERLENVERIDLCAYHPLGLEKYAAFGKTPVFDCREGTSEDVKMRWRDRISAKTNKLNDRRRS